MHGSSSEQEYIKIYINKYINQREIVKTKECIVQNNNNNDKQ